MPSRLLDLPNEILAEVFSYLNAEHLRPCDWDEDTGKYTGEEYTNANPSLCAVARVNRRLYKIARRILLEEVSLRIESSGSRCPPLFERDVLRFTKRCIENSAVLENMRKFRLFWCAPAPDDWSTNLLNTVSLAPNLTILIIGALEDGSSHENHIKNLETLVRRLRHLEIFVANTEKELPLHLFLDICNMPRLRSFETDCSLRLGPPAKDDQIVDDFWGGVPASKHCGQGTTLEKLFCTGDYLDPAVLRHIISRSPNLHTLTLSLPGPGVRFHYETYTQSEESKQPFRPCLTTLMLLPCASSLVALCISNEAMLLSQTDGTTIDLRSFHSLRRLTLSSRLLCKVTNQGSEKDPCLSIELPEKEWYKAFPLGLERLEIIFDCHRGLLWNQLVLRLLCGEYNHIWNLRNTEQAKIDEAYGNWGSDFEREHFVPRVRRELQDPSFHRLAWIMDSARAMRDEFPNLARLSVRECLYVPVDDHVYNDMCTIDLNEAYPGKFNVPGLKSLGLIVRVPYKFVAPPLETIVSESADSIFQDTAPEDSELDLIRALKAQEERQEEAEGQLIDWSDVASAWGNDSNDG